jgi:hypothetical protein
MPKIVKLTQSLTKADHMKTSRILLAGAALLGLAGGAQASGKHDELIMSVCGGCAPGQSPEAMALELTVTEVRAHNPQTQHSVIVNQPMEPYRSPISVRY